MKRSLSTILLVVLVVHLVVGGVFGISRPVVAQSVKGALGAMGGGALAGTAVAPVVGTAIGAGVGLVTYAGSLLFTKKLDSIGKGLANAILWAIAFLITLIQGLVQQLFVFFFTLLIWIAEYNDFIDTPVVRVGWVLVRDIANMFFILILLLIAFSTILGSEKLSYKQHLKSLLLMALLINFSKMITGILIDFSQVIMLTFGHALKDADPFAVVAAVAGPAGDAIEGASPDYGNLILSGIFAIIIYVAAGMVVGGMFIMLLARILFLWILVVLSPFAFLLSAFPQGQKYAQQWWQELSKNLISGPILMFFLWLALTVQGEIQLAFAGVRGKTTIIGATELGTGDVFVTFAVTMGLLLAGIKFAVDAGGAGAGAVGAVGKGIQGTARWAGVEGAKWAGGGALRRYRESDLVKKRPYLEPVSWYKGRSKYREEQQESARTEAVARSEALAIRKATGARVPVEEQVESAREEEFKKNFRFMNRNDMANQAMELAGITNEGIAKGPKSERVNDRAKRVRRGLVVTQAEEGFIDDAMSAMAGDQDSDSAEMTAWRANFRKAYLEGKTQQEAVGAFAQDYVGSKDGFQARMQQRVKIRAGVEAEAQENGWDAEKTEEEFTKRYAEDFMGKNGSNIDQHGQRILHQVSEIGKKNTHPEYQGLTVTDAKTGKRLPVFGKEQLQEAMAEGVKLGGRQMAGQAPHAYGGLDVLTGRYNGAMNKHTAMMVTSGFKGREKRIIGEWAEPRTANAVMGGTMANSSWNEEGGYMDLTQGGAAKTLQEWKKIGLDETSMSGFWEKAGGKKIESRPDNLPGIAAEMKFNVLGANKALADALGIQEGDVVTDYEIAKSGLAKHTEGKKKGKVKEGHEITEEDRAAFATQKVITYGELVGRSAAPEAGPTPPAPTTPPAAAPPPPAPPTPPGAGPTPPPVTPPPPAAPGAAPPPPGGGGEASPELLSALNQLQNTMQGMGTGFSQMKTGLQELRGGLGSFTGEVKAGMDGVANAMKQAGQTNERLMRKLLKAKEKKEKGDEKSPEA